MRDVDARPDPLDVQMASPEWELGFDLGYKTCLADMREDRIVKTVDVILASVVVTLVIVLAFVQIARQNLCGG